MGLIVDSGVLIGLERRGEAIDDLLLLDDVTAIAAITASELLVGVHRAETEQRRQSRGAYIDLVLQRMVVLPFNLAAARTYAEIWAQLLASGETIAAHDLLIAATAATHDYAVLTENTRDFQRVTGLEVRHPAW